MASFDDMPFADGAPTSGALLFLVTPSRLSKVVETSQGVQVEIAKGSRGLVVRGAAGPDHSAVLVSAADHANEALDKLAMRGLAAAQLDDAAREHVTWHCESGAPVGRIWASSAFTVTVGSPAVQVRDSSGNFVPPSPEPPVPWHPSMRYFRRSQLTDDLYDAFRNIYLALESLLSSVEPMPVNANGRPGMGESAWFKRALATAGNLVSLASYVATGAVGAPVDALHAEVYDLIRTSVFHAKGGLPVMLPQDPAHRAAVLDAKSRCTRFYLDLAEAHLGARFLSGWFTAAAFEAMFRSIADSVRFELSDDPSPAEKTDESVAPAGGAVFSLPAHRDPSLEGPMELALLARVAGSEVAAALPFITRIGAVDAATGQLAQIEAFEGRLNVDGFSTVEIVLGLRGVNGRLPKETYTS